MAMRGLSASIPLNPSTSYVPSPTTSTSFKPTYLEPDSTSADPSGLSWHATWTELPRTHLASTSSTLSVADRAVLGVLLGASTFTAGTAYALPTSMTYTVDTGEAVRTARAVLFQDGSVDFTPQLVAAADAPVTAGAPVLGLGHAVGHGQHNAKGDVTRLQTALAERGFTVGIDGKYGAGTERALRVFEAMVTGAESISDTTAVVTPGGRVDRALAAPNGPRWVEMPAGGTGFLRIDTDGFSFGSSVAAAVLIAVGQRYQTNYLDGHPGKSLIGLNDTSRQRGGAHRDHESHQAGLDMDIALPTLTGGHGTRVGHASYDRDTTYAMIEALAQDPRVERILFTDAVILQRIADANPPWRDKVQDGGPKHKNHLHVDVRAWSPG